MFLGTYELKKKIEEENLIENYSKECIQSSGYDLRLNKLFEIVSLSFIGISEKEMPKIKEIQEKKEILGTGLSLKEFFIIEPKKYYLATTLEKINMPSNLVAFIFNRSSLFRCGASIRSAVVDPGYKGELTIGIKNEAMHSIRIEKHARFAQICFAEVHGEVSPYRGSYQGGKII